MQKRAQQGDIKGKYTEACTSKGQKGKYTEVCALHNTATERTNIQRRAQQGEKG